MSTLIKLIFTLWPFIKEMVLKDKESRKFVEQNKHSLLSTAAAVLLFILFTNAYMDNLHFSQLIYEAQKESEYHKEKYMSLKETYLELKREHTSIRSALFSCAGMPELILVADPKSQPAPPETPVINKPDIILNNSQWNRERKDKDEDR